jgi:hypothetical protein
MGDAGRLVVWHGLAGAAVRATGIDQREQLAPGQPAAGNQLSMFCCCKPWLSSG